MIPLTAPHLTPEALAASHPAGPAAYRAETDQFAQESQQMFMSAMVMGAVDVLKEGRDPADVFAALLQATCVEWEVDLDNELMMALLSQLCAAGVLTAQTAVRQGA